MVAEVLILMVRHCGHAVLGLKLVLLKKSVTAFSPLCALVVPLWLSHRFSLYANNTDTY